jgi:superfamily II DNA/RNA helicase
MGYFNSIRELGGARSLVSGDVVERLKQIQNRELISNSYQRRIRENNVRELTSRMDDAQIPVILKELENSFSQNNNAALDICLATNMVATGVDISRLGMMFIHGQPKTNAEYIQAGSRVGRDLPEGPGLVVTLYSPSKPRDKSHYEQFQGYHSRIYERVEPTSVTPFSISSREKGLHAVFIGLVRHFASGELKNTPNPAASDEFNPMTEKVKNLLLERCRRADSREYEETESEIDEVIRIWRAREFQYYGDAMNMQYNYGRDVLMMARTGESDDEERAREHSFPTLTSMRGVSSESEVNVT